MKKYCVHMGVRLTKNFYVIAHDEDEAERLTDNLFANINYSDMEYAGSDADIWEIDFDDEKVDAVSEWEDEEYKEVFHG